MVHNWGQKEKGTTENETIRCHGNFSTYTHKHSVFGQMTKTEFVCELFNEFWSEQNTMWRMQTKQSSHTLKSFQFLEKQKWKLVAQSSPTLCDPMDVTHQAALSMEFSRQEYCRG